MATDQNSRAEAGGGTATAVDQGMIARAVAGVRYVFTGKTDWFGPGESMQPVAPQAEGRAFDYPFAINQQIRPRAGESVTFEQLRAVADGYDLMRLIIETRKDQILAQPWTIKPKDPKSKRTPSCDEVQLFLESPDKEHTWNTWLRMLLEDLFVLDAPTIYPRSTRGGQLYSLELVDGATIKRILDATGRTPVPPDPAYQQVLKGMPAVNYTREELIYAPRNPRTNKVYGYSPVEQVITTVNIALRRQTHQLQYYTEGNIPEALIAVPETWNATQIRDFQTHWDSVLEGNTAKRRKAIFVPGGMEPTFTKEGVLKDQADEWFARVVCFAFSVSPTPFVQQVNRATAESAQETAKEEGLVPLMQWVKDTVNMIIVTRMGRPDVEFAWDKDEIADAKTRAEVDKIYVDAKVLHPDEVREKMGMEPMSKEQRDSLAPAPIVGPDGLPLQPGQQAKPGAEAEKLEKKKQAGSTVIGLPSPSRAPRFKQQ